MKGNSQIYPGTSEPRRRSERRRPRFYASAAWRAARAAAIARDGLRCVECGRAGRLEVHHVKPIKEGGRPLALENLRTLCRACHFRIEPRRVRRTARESWRRVIDAEA